MDLVLARPNFLGGAGRNVWRGVAVVVANREEVVVLSGKRRGFCVVGGMCPRKGAGDLWC